MLRACVVCIFLTLVASLAQRATFAQQYLTAQTFVDAELPKRFSDPAFQMKVRKLLTLNYPSVADWEKIPITSDTPKTRLKRQDFSPAFALRYGKPSFLIFTTPGQEVNQHIVPDMNPRVLAVPNCGQPGSTVKRTALGRQETAAERTERRKREIETNVDVSGKVTGGLGEATASFNQRVLQEIEVTEHNKLTLIQEVEDAGEFYLEPNGITILHEASTVRISTRRVLGKALISVPIRVDVYTGGFDFIRPPFTKGVKIPKHTALEVGDWSVLDAEEFRSLPLETEVTVRTIIRVSGVVDSQKYATTEECRAAATSLAARGSTQAPLSLADQSLNVIDLQGSERTMSLASPNLSASNPKLDSPDHIDVLAIDRVLSQEKELLEALYASDNGRLVCDVSANGRHSGSDIRTTFSVNITGCAKPKTTYGQITYAVRYRDSQGREHIARNYSTRWNDREPPRFKHDQTDRQPLHLDEFLETIEPRITDCECK